MTRIKLPPKAELESEYSAFGATISSLAKKYNTTNPTVRGWLKKYDIPRKSHKQASQEANSLRRNNIPSKEILLKHYEQEQLPLHKLCKIFGVGLITMRMWLSHHNIKIRNISESTLIAKQKQFKDIQFSKKIIEQTLKESDYNKLLASEKLDISLSHIKVLISRYNIDCPNYIGYKSKAELELLEFCKHQRPDLTWISGDKTIINPYEIDIYCPELNFGIEYCGLYWHSQYYGKKDPTYHYTKWNLCNEKDIDLITVFEYDNMEKIKYLILKKLNKIKSIYGRKTLAIELSSNIANEFHNKHHLHGTISSKVNLGLLYENELVLVASFSKSRFNKNYQWECTRCTTHPSIGVIGGVSKLFKKFIRDYEPDSIITYSDLRFGKGRVYSYCGFQCEGITPPNYWYFHKNNPKLHSRSQFQKHKLKEKLENYSSELTEYQNMINNGWDRIWDCGNMKYTYRK